MADRIQIRRDITANWVSVNPILALGELGIETDTNRVKRGDGTTQYSVLPYLIDSLFTSAEKTKLSGIAAGAQVNTVTSVDGATGAITVVGKIPVGGATSQTLTKTSNADYAVSWQTPTASASSDTDGGTP